MIISFPSTLWCFSVDQPIKQGTHASVFHVIGTAALIEFTAPIPLKPRDEVFIDVRNGQVEMIMRGLITIWHSAWRN